MVPYSTFSFKNTPNLCDEAGVLSSQVDLNNPKKYFSPNDKRTRMTFLYQDELHVWLKKKVSYSLYDLKIICLETGHT